MLLHRYGHMVHEYYVERVRAIMAARRERIAALKTRAEAQKYVRRIRAAALKCFGPLPQRTPLKARITGRDEYRRYVLEKIVFESRPGFLVTGNLYLPKGGGGKSPGVLGLCGHSLRGKAEAVYQSFAQGLADKGFVVFMIDPISQGERRQFYAKDGGARPALCHAHNLMGNPMTLVDDFFGAWRVWDAIRGLDYLLTRPEVDCRRVGVTGNSGGGTLTTYVTALDPRLTMAAPSCYIASYLANLENELPADSEQNPPGILGAGLDQVDLLLCHAPRPTIILAQIDDFFDERAARQARQDLRKVHALLGGEKSAACFVGPRGHGYHLENREAMYRFFMRHAGVSGSAKERGIKPLAAERTFATPRGETHKLGSRRVFEYTAATAARLAKKRGQPSAAKVAAAARKLLGISLRKRPPHYRVLRFAGGLDQQNPSYQFAVETDPGIQAIVTCCGRNSGFVQPPTGRVTLYVGHTSSREDARAVKEIRALARRKRQFVTVDPRGIGDSVAMTCGDKEFFAPYGSDFLYASYGDMLGESYLGRRVFDVMRTIDFLLAGGATPVDLVGRGLGSLTVAFAALLHPSRPRAHIFHYLPSYELICRTPLANWPFSALLRGGLHHFDLPDVYRALGRRLRQEKPWDARMRPPKK